MQCAIQDERPQQDSTVHAPSSVQADRMWSGPQLSVNLSTSLRCTVSQALTTDMWDVTLSIFLGLAMENLQVRFAFCFYFVAFKFRIERLVI